jgi:hypothetical protein
MRQTLTALLAVSALLLVHGLLDRFDRTNDDRIAYARWVRESCLPSAEGDRAIARINAGKLDCAIVSGGGYGRAAPVIVSAATLELPE